ncbi:MAG TPA: transcriptional regulator [Armatimonadota bacterium]|jgi:hypothetical protein
MPHLLLFLACALLLAATGAGLAAPAESSIAHPVSGWGNADLGSLKDAPVKSVELLPGPPPRLRVKWDKGSALVSLDGREIVEEAPAPPHSHPAPPKGIPKAWAADAAGNTWVASDEGLWRLTAGMWAHYPWEGVGTGLPDGDVRDVKVDDQGHVWAATAKGLALFIPPKGWETFTGADGLPVEDVTCIAFGPKGERWFGTAQGLVCLREGRWEYYAGRRWLPNDRVNAVVVTPEGGVVVATAGGLGRIQFQPLTLEQKAQHIEEVIRLRHWRGGYVSSCTLQRPGDLSSFIYQASDNDGLWTAIYLGAECFRYAATGAPEAKRLADESARALLELESCTTLEGFPARARVFTGERVDKSSGEWHPTRDGKGEWKGDTSSDELDGHYFGLALYYDLVAGETEKRQVRQTLTRITDHLLRNDFALIDVDGKPTRWAVHGPKALNDDPAWVEEKGLNSLEILAHLRTAHHVTGEPRYLEAYNTLVTKHHYALNTLRQKRDWPDEINHSDDELAFLAYFPLLRYETDPDLRALYLASLERSWRILQPQASTLFDFIYAASTGRRDMLGPGVRVLEETPLDLVTWTMSNSHRADLKQDPRFGRFGEKQCTTPVPPRERAAQKWNSNPYQMDTGNGGLEEDDGAFYLLPYWMGRYYGLLGSSAIPVPAGR